MCTASEEKNADRRTMNKDVKIDALAVMAVPLLQFQAHLSIGWLRWSIGYKITPNYTTLVASELKRA